MKQDRRTFIKVTSLASATLVPVVGTLAQVFGKKEEEITNLLGGSFNKDLEFHVIDNNLLNLHFYFINVKKSGSFIIPDKADNKSFMVVRLPQMHVSEKGYWDKDWTEGTHPENKYPNAKLSGYSYLAFQLWPNNPTAKQQSPHKKLRFTLENVLNWNDQNNFELITLVEWFKLKNENITEFEFLDLTTNCDEFKERKIWNKKTAKNETYYETNEPIKDGYKKYKSIVTTLFDCNYNSKETPKCFIPITFFEVPQEVCLVPISRDASGKLSKVSKQFWQNKFVNQEKQAFGYRKYEIWNNTLFYKAEIKNEKEQETTYKIETPSFRIAGLITEQDVKCEIRNEVKCQELQPEWNGFLPSLLDKAELAFLTQYANDEKNNRDYREAKYDIKELNGFFFTGLGIITHLKYYNEDAPKGVDLIEYEHIITEGRDIFIKVARIGIHNKNGKRYKHVVEGKRKITDEIKDSNGNLVLSGATSFVELKQYCECIEKKKNYEFPENPTKEIWSVDNFEYPNFTSHEVFEPAKLNKPHYRRYPWKELRTIEKERIPIKPYQDGNESSDPFANLWFWPVLEKTISNSSPKYLNSIFDADDWDKGTLNLGTPFIFIRKSVIECGKSDEIKNLTNSYFKHNPNDANDPINLRRKIAINNQKIAFTKPLPAKVSTPTALENEEELLNQSRSKTHIIETEYIETYFNFTKQTAFDDIKNPFSKVRFPILPQVLRAKVFVDHIRDLTQKKISSIVEYHVDYIKHEFEDTFTDKQYRPEYLPSLIDGSFNSKSLEKYANAAKLILANTDAFINGKEELVNNKYGEIKNALQEAKDKLGNLAVPDIIPDTISLEKFGVTLPKDINNSIATGRTVLSDAPAGLQKIAGFNPRELLRGKLSDVCGLDLTAILDELIPASSDNNQTPLFEINKIANKITSEVEGSEVFRDIKTNIERVKEKITELEDGYKTLASQINGKEQDLKNNLKKLRNYIPNSDDLDSFIKNEFEQLRIEAFDLVLDDLPFEETVSKVTDAKKAVDEFLEKELTLLTAEFNGKKNEILEYFKPLSHEIAQLPSSLNNVEDLINVRLKSLYTVTVQDYIDNIKVGEILYKGSCSVTNISGIYYKKINNKITWELSNDINDTPLKLCTITLDSNQVPNNIGFIQYTQLLNYIQTFIVRNVNGNEIQKNAANTLKNLLTTQFDKEIIIDGVKTKLSSHFLGTVQNYRNDIITIKNQIKEWQTKAEQAISVAQNQFQAFAISKVQDAVRKLVDYVDFMNKFDSYYYHTTQQQLIKDIKDIGIRFHQTISNEIKSLEDAIKVKFNEYIANREVYYKVIIPFQKALNDFENAGTAIPAKIRDDFNKAKQDFGDFKSTTIDKLKDEAKSRVLSYITSLTNNSEIKAVYEAIYGKPTPLNPDGTRKYPGLVAEVEATKKKYQGKLLVYKKYVDDNIKLLGDDMVDQIATYIANHPDEVEKVKEAQNIYRLLTSIKQQDLTYNWNITSFRDVNLGIVSFKKFSNPDTTLKVDVKATTYFTSGKFPPAIERVVTYSENRFTNFGISFFNSLTVNFNEISFIAGSDHSTHFDVKIKDVKFDGALSFVQAFESWLQTMGKGLILQLHGDHVALGYSLAIPAIKTPGFNIFNLSLNFDLRVYFDKRPLRFGFSLARPDSKFGIAAGIYAGFGFFSIVADPKKGIVEIDCALEAGAWAGISFGPFSGEVKLAFGFRYTKNEFGVRLEGYIVAEGRLSFWIIEVAARIYLGVVSQNSYVEGVCTVTYSVKIGFIKKSFSGTFHKKIAGANSNNSNASSLSIAETHALLETNFHRETFSTEEKAYKKRFLLSDTIALSSEQHREVSNLTLQSITSKLMKDSYNNEVEELVIAPVEFNEWKDFINTF